MAKVMGPSIPVSGRGRGPGEREGEQEGGRKGVHRVGKRSLKDTIPE